MNINKLLNGVKNISQVYEGVKNKMFKRSYVENIADHRWQICKTCPELDIDGSRCAAPGTQPCCANCGCSLGFKTRALSSSCPLDKWPSLMSEEDEKALFEEIQTKEREMNNDEKADNDKFKNI